MIPRAMKHLYLAQYLVNRFGHVPGGVTPLKLQKLLYYVKAWSLVDGRDLVGVPFEKWQHGPVNRDVYQYFKRFGRAPLQPEALAPSQEPQGATREFIDFVGHSYARFPAITLSKMTHEEDPWRLTPDDAVIADTLIARYYAAQPFATNLPFDPVGKPYVPVQSHMDRAATMDMSAADAKRASTYASYQDYLARLESAGFVSRDEWLSQLLA
ncbi:MAG: type II toxin-antitoxin system antitoxin SocA domain-containing protein [Bacteroidota bacterium]